jgi:general secretion pathway protein L
MTVLRIRGSLADTATRCRWTLTGAGRETVHGEGTPDELPRRARRVELVLPASEVLITRTRLPPGAARRGGAVLAFALEDQTLGDPEANQVSRLGAAGDADVLAVFDKAGLQRWLAALAAAGLEPDVVWCETLLLPLAPGEWSVAWNGVDGFVRTALLEGAATDCGDAHSPPLSLALMLEAAAASDAVPGAIAVYPTAADAAPDLDAWHERLGIPLRLARPWDGSEAPSGGISLAHARGRWRIPQASLTRFKPAALIVSAALAIHALALVADWAALAGERRAVRRQMEARFRTLFPDTVAIVDPGLQMRRKLADARHAAGLADAGDFLPMIDRVAAAMADLPPSTLRTGSYETGRLTLELAALDEDRLRRIVTRLKQAGLAVDTARTTAARGQPAVLVTVRAS